MEGPLSGVTAQVDLQARLVREDFGAVRARAAARQTHLAPKVEPQQVWPQEKLLAVGALESALHVRARVGSEAGDVRAGLSTVLTREGNNSGGRISAVVVAISFASASAAEANLPLVRAGVMPEVVPKGVYIGGGHDPEADDADKTLVLVGKVLDEFFVGDVSRVGVVGARVDGGQVRLVAAGGGG